MVIPQTLCESLTPLTLDAERGSSSDHLVPIHVSRGSHAGSESCHSNQCKILVLLAGLEPARFLTEGFLVPEVRLELTLLNFWSVAYEQDHMIDSLYHSSIIDHLTYSNKSLVSTYSTTRADNLKKGAAKTLQFCFFILYSHNILLIVKFCCVCLYYWRGRWDSNPGLRPQKAPGFRDRCFDR